MRRRLGPPAGALGLPPAEEAAGKGGGEGGGGDGGGGEGGRLNLKGKNSEPP